MLSVSAHLDYIYAVACVWSNHVVAQVHLTVVSRRTNPSAQVRVGQLGPRRADLQRVRHCPRLLVCMMPQTEPPPHTSSCTPTRTLPRRARDRSERVMSTWLSCWCINRVLRYFEVPQYDLFGRQPFGARHASSRVRAATCVGLLVSAQETCCIFQIWMHSALPR